MPLRTMEEFDIPDEKRFRIGLVGQGPALRALVRILERPDFSAAFPRVKVAGWCPQPGIPVENAAAQTPSVLQHLALFTSIAELFAVRPGIHLALDLTPQNDHIAAIRAAAPLHTTVASSAAILQFCMAAEEGKLAIGGGESLRKAQGLFSLLVDQMDDDILIISDEGIILDMNHHAAASRGIQRHAVIGSHCMDFDATTPCCDDEAHCPFAVALTTGKKTDRLFTQVRPDGKVRYLHSFCFPLSDPGGSATQFLFMQRDVTEKQHLEQRLQQTEKMAAIGELSTYMAHEIRNPLFSIGGFANALLRNPSLDENSREKARIIFEESRRLDDILKNILNFARPTQQAIAIFDLEPVARQTMELMTLGGAERGIRAEISIPPGLPKVRGNAENLKQCLINLVKNAMEAMPEGGIVRLIASRDKGEVRVEVRDTGVGITPELHEQVFSPFFSTKHGGAGLGLAMTRKVMEEMGGSVLLSSKLGKGTSVTLALPAALAVEE